MNLEELLIDALGKVKATDVVVYDMDGKSPFYDKMIVATVSSTRQASAVTDYIEMNFKDTDYKIRKVEGAESSWVLVDCYDIIVSVFTKEEREHFSLDKLYMDLNKRVVEDK